MRNKEKNFNVIKIKHFNEYEYIDMDYLVHHIAYLSKELEEHFRDFTYGELCSFAGNDKEQSLFRIYYSANKGGLWYSKYNPKTGRSHHIKLDHTKYLFSLQKIVLEQEKGKP